MDAPEEDLDIKLQKISGDLISEFNRSLRPLLRKPDGTVRGQVRWPAVTRLMSSVLDPFQEFPQLLDPHLSGWAQTLADAFLEHLQSPRRRSKARPQARPDVLMPLPAAVCKLIYALCKIRGEKVMVRFLSVETRYLELLLSALEEAERSAGQRVSTASLAPHMEEGSLLDHEAALATWPWEERYVMLLWLSHLFLAPFDLSTISSIDLDDEDLPDIAGFRWPPNVPGITVRVLPLALKYLSSPGKERDAARALLVRMAMRKDMQELGILHALVQWSLYSIRPKKEDEVIDTPYYYIGVLSFLAGILASSSNTSDMDKYLTTVFYATNNIPANKDPASRVIASSALARKTMIKVIRSIVVLLLRRPLTGRAETALVETAIGRLLDSLADNDTPVRFAASKALSVIALKLEPHLASQVVDAVLESLDRNVLWIKSSGDGTAALRTRDLSSVDPLEWHGLMLTLSHLIYRRSPPAGSLSGIIHALLTGLSFERRGASGASIGTNIRDAACFGIWALARRYTTKELLAVPTADFHGAALSPSGSPSYHRPQHASVLQILATELVVTASLDPSGNIRRGSSAALQELVGRHPDTVEKGIWVVQTVDYHAVALRSRAVSQVSMNATRLSATYGEAILDALLGWRGIGDGDAAARRVAGRTFGTVSMELALMHHDQDPLGRFEGTIEMVIQNLHGLKPREVEERHGLLITLAAVLDSFPSLVRARTARDGSDKETVQPLLLFHNLLYKTLLSLTDVLSACKGTIFRRPELVAEAGSQLIGASFPILQAATTLRGGSGALNPTSPLALLPGRDLIAASRKTTTKDSQEFRTLVRSLDEKGAAQTDKGDAETVQRFLTVAQEAISEWLGRAEEEVIHSAAGAALVLLVFTGSACEARGVARTNEAATSRAQKRLHLVGQWAQAIRHRPTAASSLAGADAGYFFALAMAHPIIAVQQQEQQQQIHDSGEGGGHGEEESQQISSTIAICHPILERWRLDKNVETRVSILQSLTGSELLREEGTAELLLPLVAEGLEDYTTTARGDVGSHVRLQALKATKGVWESIRQVQVDEEEDEEQTRRCRVVISTLFLRVLRLAAEKLDKVRAEAQRALAMALEESWSSRILKSTFSSRPYYAFLLNLLNTAQQRLHPAVSAAAAAADEGRWMDELMAGYVTSADAGHEDLVIASREALAAHCASSRAKLDRVCGALVRNLRGRHRADDRVVVPTLNIVSFLFHAGLLQRCAGDGGVLNSRSLCLAVQRCCYRTGSFRKLEAGIRVYGAVAGLDGGGGGGGSGGAAAGTVVALSGPESGDTGADNNSKSVGAAEARRRLGALLLHPWPKVRSLVVDELWVLLSARELQRGEVGVADAADAEAGSKEKKHTGAGAAIRSPAEKLKGVDWGTADKGRLKALLEELGLN